jgi:hypothetical protein
LTRLSALPMVQFRDVLPDHWRAGRRANTVIATPAAERCGK